MTASDEHEAHLQILRALFQLKTETPIWETNYRKFLRLGTERRTWWWAAFKKQAEAGAPAPRALLIKIIEMRLTE